MKSPWKLERVKIPWMKAKYFFAFRAIKTFYFSCAKRSE